MVKRVVIGTRGSDLALRQTAIVQEKILVAFPSLEVELKIIKTEGDRYLKPFPENAVGKGFFTKEIEKELLDGAIDLAVHSLKDLPVELPEGLRLGAIIKREDAREVLISKSGRRLRELPAGAIIGTDSLRRKVQVLNLRPDLIVESIRGNILTRIRKLETEHFDALILAAAGLQRLQMERLITEYFEPKVFMPAAGQGALAIEHREGNGELLPLLSAINHAPTETVVAAERAFARTLGGGCKVPVGAFASLTGDVLTLLGMIGETEGNRLEMDEIRGGMSEARELGERLSRQMLSRIGARAGAPARKGSL